MKAFRAPRGKIVRSFGINIFESPKYDKILDSRPNPPGVHGAKRKRAKVSEYGRQLIEKQKVKFCYGLSERQFRNAYEKADRKKGPTGIVLLQSLESRFDNVVFRAGFAVSRAQARQMVKHSHFRVNGKKVNVPSYQIKPGDVIGVRPKPGSQKLMKQGLEDNKWRESCGWIQNDPEKTESTYLRIPSGEEIPRIADEQQIVELYSK